MRTRLGEIFARAAPMSDSDGERCRAAMGAQSARPARIAALRSMRRPDVPLKWILLGTMLQDCISLRRRARTMTKKKGDRLAVSLLSAYAGTQASIFNGEGRSPRCSQSGNRRDTPPGNRRGHQDPVCIRNPLAPVRADLRGP